LNEAFEKLMMYAVGFQPQLFEHVVGFVIALVVETKKVADIVGIPIGVRAGIEAFYVGGDAMTLLHETTTRIVGR
jgi:hypothetical protein